MELFRALKKHFGYDQFRPLQREIMQDALAGRDLFVLMPTGGGKSLCFQLPALMRDGLTIVVSPLIALMKDQVDALQTSGIPATYLNSTLDQAEAKLLSLSEEAGRAADRAASRAIRRTRLSPSDRQARAARLRRGGP